MLLFSMVAHEWAHGEAAYRQGDDTAYMLGRVSFNPLKHIDPFMTIILPVGLWLLSHGAWTFGAAKPVPVNPRKFRQFRRGDLIVSLAGIAMNLALFVACGVLFAAAGLVGGASPGFAGTLQRMLWYGMLFNLLLAFFNLIPIPPLDGSHVLYHVLPPAAGLQYRRLARFGFLPIMAVAFLLPGVVDVFLWPATQLMLLARTLLHPFAVGVA